MNRSKAETPLVPTPRLSPAERAGLRVQLDADAESGGKDPLRSTVAAAALVVADQLERIADALEHQGSGIPDE